jgi:para-nitrobenzyl esterase
MPPLERRRRLVHAEEYWISCIRVGEARARLGAATYMYRSDRVLRTGAYAGFAPSGSDIPLAFDTLDLGEVVATGAVVTAEDRSLAATAHAAWVSFIKTGAPAAPTLPAWPRYAAPDDDPRPPAGGRVRSPARRTAAVGRQLRLRPVRLE